MNELQPNEIHLMNEQQPNEKQTRLYLCNAFKKCEVQYPTSCANSINEPDLLTTGKNQRRRRNPDADISHLHYAAIRALLNGKINSN